MSRSLDDTPQSEQMQQAALESNLWNTEVVPRLPPDLGTQARTLKAFVRVREVKCASDLLGGLLAYVLCAPPSSAWERGPCSLGWLTSPIVRGASAC